jgi:SAM-dependent methyltransferase
MASDTGPLPEVTPRVTRGRGLLEGWLSRQRSRIANRLIPDPLRSGRILDIGCGSHPLFLASTRFEEKFALDQIAMPPQVAARHGIVHRTHDLGRDPRLPFEDGCFSAITLLAVVEHLPPDSAVRVLSEAHRTLRPGGAVVVTTPAAWADGLLHFMARVGLVSSDEIDEHAFAYSLPLLGACLGAAGFKMQKLRFGTFELRLNLWASAERE